MASWRKREGTGAAPAGWARAPVTLMLMLWLMLASTVATAKQQDTHNPLELLNMPATTHSLDSSVKMRVNATRLGNGEWVEVSWRGVPHPSYADWVGLMVPAGAEPSTTSPAKYQLAAMDVDHTHLSKGEGRLRFRVLNYRAPVEFLFFRGGLMQPTLAARSPAIQPASPNEPLQRRLALTRNNTQMVVQWTTRDTGTPVVRFGSAPGTYTHTVPAASGSYSLDDVCGPPANTVGWVAPGTFHTALLEGLLPGRRYYYVVGDEAWGFSPEASFLAAPPVGPTTSVKLVAVADLGQAEEDGSMEQSEMAPSLATTRRIAAELQAGASYQLLLHEGDISYAQGYVTQWDNYMHQMEPLISTLPYMVVPGNHERDWPASGDRFGDAEDSGGECGVALERRFAMPISGPDKPWFSFDFGPIHFLQYSTEHVFAPGSEQHEWVLLDLASVDRSRTPWLVVGGHRPMYISSTNTMPGQGDQPVAADLRAAFEEAFVRFKVDLTLHGHHHSYQRTCPVINGTCQQGSQEDAAIPSSNSSSSSRGRDGRPAAGRASVYVDARAPVHLVIGNGGAELSLNVDPHPSDIWQTIRLWWGYLRIHADGTQLRCEAVSDLDGTVMDMVTLIKSDGRHTLQQQQQEQQQEQEQEQEQQQQQQAASPPGVPHMGRRQAAHAAAQWLGQRQAHTWQELLTQWLQQWQERWQEQSQQPAART